MISGDSSQVIRIGVSTVWWRSWGGRVSLAVLRGHTDACCPWKTHTHTHTHRLSVVTVMRPSHFTGFTSIFVFSDFCYHFACWSQRCLLIYMYTRRCIYACVCMYVWMHGWMYFSSAICSTWFGGEREGCGPWRQRHKASSMLGEPRVDPPEQERKIRHGQLGCPILLIFPWNTIIYITLHKHRRYNAAQKTGHTMLPQRHFCRTISILRTQST